MFKEFEKRLITSLILIPISIFSIVKGSIFFIFFLSILFLAASYEWIIMSKKNNLLRLLGIIFLFFSFYSAFEFGENYKDFLFIMTICIFTDLGGYIFGKIFKGPKLTKLSPNKTYAGVLGGYICSIIFYFIILKTNLVNKQYFINFLIFVLLISSISQFGDIIVSYFKRLSKIKNTGKLIPGHGGILDRIDGMIFAFPFYYFIHLIIF